MIVSKKLNLLFFTSLFMLNISQNQLRADTGTDILNIMTNPKDATQGIAAICLWWLAADVILTNLAIYSGLATRSTGIGYVSSEFMILPIPAITIYGVVVKPISLIMDKYFPETEQRIIRDAIKSQLSETNQATRNTKMTDLFNYLCISRNIDPKKLVAKLKDKDIKEILKMPEFQNLKNDPNFKDFFAKINDQKLSMKDFLDKNISPDKLISLPTKAEAAKIEVELLTKLNTTGTDASKVLDAIEVVSNNRKLDPDAVYKEFVKTDAFKQLSLDTKTDIHTKVESGVTLKLNELPKNTEYFSTADQSRIQQKKINLTQKLTDLQNIKLNFSTESSPIIQTSELSASLSSKAALPSTMPMEVTYKPLDIPVEERPIERTGL